MDAMTALRAMTAIPSVLRSMTASGSLVALLATVALSTSGCRLDSGPDDYASQESLRLDAAPPPIDADIEDGERRLSIGAFYEGPAVETVVVDNVSAHFYVYEDTFAATVEGGDRVEGSQSDRLIHRGGPWWGGGIHWDVARDVTGYATLEISLKSSDLSYAGLQLAMNGPGENQGTVDAEDYGFATDGEWHRLQIPLSDYAAAGVDLSQVSAPLIFVGGAGESGHSILVDGVFFTDL